MTRDIVHVKKVVLIIQEHPVHYGAEGASVSVDVGHTPQHSQADWQVGLCTGIT